MFTIIIKTTCLINYSKTTASFICKRLNPFNFFKKQQATNAEIAAANLKAKQELDAKLAAEKAASTLQSQLETGTYGRGDAPDRDRRTVTKESAAKTKGVGGGGYTKSDATRESYRGKYNRGGLATMFTRRR